ncbi:MAG: histidinol-phosphate transaminase [Sedimentitalea sp.]
MDDMTAPPQSYLVPLPVRSVVARAQPKGLPVIRMGYNELPFGPTPGVAAAIADFARTPNFYGGPGCDEVRLALGRINGIDPDEIICGNGSEELLDVIARNFVRPGDEILISEFGYIQFALTAHRLGVDLVKAPETGFATDVDALLAGVSARTRLLFLANPNNPTGTVVPLAELERLVAGVPEHVVVVLDLAYGEFTGFEYCAGVHALAGRQRNVIVTRTFSKAFGLAGLRCGWAHAPADMLPGFYAARGMGSVNGMAQVAAKAALEEMDEVRARVDLIVSERDRVAAALRDLGVLCLPSGTNFLMATVDGHGAEVTEALVEYLFDEGGFVVNRTREAGLEHFLRFCLSLPEHNDLLIETVGRFVATLGA